MQRKGERIAVIELGRGLYNNTTGEVGGELQGEVEVSGKIKDFMNRKNGGYDVSKRGKEAHYNQVLAKRRQNPKKQEEILDINIPSAGDERLWLQEKRSNGGIQAHHGSLSKPLNPVRERKCH